MDLLSFQPKIAIIFTVGAGIVHYTSHITLWPESVRKEPGTVYKGPVDHCNDFELIMLHTQYNECTIHYFPTLSRDFFFERDAISTAEGARSRFLDPVAILEAEVSPDIAGVDNEWSCMLASFSRQISVGTVG